MSHFFVAFFYQNAYVHWYIYEHISINKYIEYAINMSLSESPIDQCIFFSFHEIHKIVELKCMY